MTYLLFGGAPNVGKTGTIFRLALALIKNKNFVDIHGKLPVLEEDFRATLEGIQKNGTKIRVMMNSVADGVNEIQMFKDYCEQNKPYHFVMSSVRDCNFWPRKDFYKIMKIGKDDHVIEIPMAKITRRNNRCTARKWYESTIDLLVMHILGNYPFNI